MSRGWAGIAAMTFVLGTSSIAHAQQLGGQRFEPAGSEDGVLGTQGSDIRRPLRPYIALVANYALNPVVVLDSTGEGDVVRHVLAADLVGSIAVYKGLEFGLLVPISLFATGEGNAASQLGLPRVHGAAFGDLSIRVAYRVALTYRDSLALHFSVLLPTASDDDPLAFGFGVKPVLAYTHGFKHADLVLNFSYAWRDRVNVLDYQGGQELGARVGVRIGLDEHWDTGLLVEAGVSTSVHDFFGAAETPAEIRAGVEHWFNPHIRLTGFAGTALSTGVGAPDFRVGVGIGYGEQPRRPRIVPLEGDRDADGVPDENDRCPDDPEDEDDFQDDDGCPEEDNDHDGIEDDEDHCPNEPETQDGIADEDGCPDHIQVEGTLIVTFEPVQFETGSDRILEESNPMLNEIAGVMETNPGMRISIEGHSDSEGEEDFNLRLSQERADSVRRYLIRRGIDGDRIEAHGYGESRPVADNETEEGRQTNRRVEFHIAE